MSDKTVTALNALVTKRQLEPYLRHIRFPTFRNIASMTQIDFTYPLTALIGPNGTNKTAILRAIEGSTDYVGLGTTWFSTDLDPIDSRNRHQVVHGYFSSGYGQVVEAIKIRIRAAGAKSAGRKIDPDYFEPSRPLMSAGMSRMPSPDEYPTSAADRTQTRWKAIDKVVLYLDFRTEISAFDKFFHHGPSGSDESTQQRKDKIRRWSRRLAKAFDEKLESDSYFGTERIVEGPIEASKEELAIISSILGRSYRAITFIKHEYFRVSGQDGASWTIRMQTDNLRYSEAFAGSGEFAVTMLVHHVLAAEPRTLILLDEPEVSLHPAAQRAVIEFLSKQVMTRKHQVVLATHSPEMIRDLPPHAIKVLDLDPSTSKVVLTSQATAAQDAFVRLGSASDTAMKVYLEDELAVMLVRRALKNESAATLGRIGLHVMGGSKRILTHFGPALAKAGVRDSIVLLDGDENRGPIPSAADTPASDLEQVLTAICGSAPSIYADGGDDPSASSKKNAARHTLLEWMHANVRYLPGKSCPEGLILELEGGPTTDHDGATSTSTSTSTSRELKAMWASETAKSLDLTDGATPTSAEILFYQRQRLADVPVDHPVLASIRDVVLADLARIDSDRGIS